MSFEAYSKYEALPPTLRLSDDSKTCALCASEIIYHTRMESVGVGSYVEDCNLNSCYRCGRGKGCGGWTEVKEEIRQIPECTRCNSCRYCTKTIFNTSDYHTPGDALNGNTHSYPSFVKTSEDTFMHAKCVTKEKRDSTPEHKKLKLFSRTKHAALQ